MAVELKPGTRLRSATCETEVVVVKAPAVSVDLRCGGYAMVGHGQTGPSSMAAKAGFDDDGAELGKRYTDEAGELELLCTKGGSSSLSIGEAPLVRKDAKPLPSSD